MGRVIPYRMQPPHGRLKLPADLLVKSVIIDKNSRKLAISTTGGDISIDMNSLVNPTMTKNYQTNRQKVEKRFTIPSDKFSLVDFTDLGVVEENTSVVPKFVIGENYALGGEIVEGFKTKYRLYNLVGMVDEFAGTKVDSLIVKQIGGEDSGNIYTISKNDCMFLGIEYQNGLQLFSKSLSWKHVRNVPEFNKNNLGTSPTSEIDNSIRYLVLKLDGFTDYSDGYVLSPSSKLIKENQFVQSIQVITKEPVVYGNGHIIQDKTPLRASVTHPRARLFNHGNFISSENEVFVIIELVDRLNFSDANTFDGKFGVDPKYFEGINPNDYFEVSWDEFGGLTIEEYDEIKRKREEEAERIAKEKEEKEKKLLEEAEKAAAEKKRLEELAIERMKKYKLVEPQIPEIPSFNYRIEPIVGVDMYIDDVNAYLNSLNRSLNSLSKDLSKFGKNFLTPSDATINMWNSAYRQGMISANSLNDFLEEFF